MLFITHDLGVVAELCDDVLVMYAGRVAEHAPVEELFAAPRHPYTRGLIASHADARHRGEVRAARDRRRRACAQGPAARLPLLESLPLREATSAARSCRHSSRCGLEHDVALPSVARSCRHDARRCSRFATCAKYFPVRAGVLLRKVGDVHAVDDVSFTLERGRTLGLVGESGCGKIDGRPHAAEPAAEERRPGAVRRPRLERAHKRPSGGRCAAQMQIVFQDPMESLNPRHTVGRILEEPFVIHGLGDAAFRRVWVAELLERVGLPPSAADRFPHEFSGGQRQRIGIARAIALKPKLIVCDEAGLGARRLDPRADHQSACSSCSARSHLALLFIAHDLAVVRHVSDEVAVMYLGSIVEQARRRPRSTCGPRIRTRARLISAIPVPDPNAQARAHRAARRRAVADQPAAGLPLPYPLPVRGGRLPRPTCRSGSPSRRATTSRAISGASCRRRDGVDAGARHRARAARARRTSRASTRITRSTCSIATQVSRRPHVVHPVFFGCFDWHSAVHTHWLLVRLLGRLDAGPLRSAIESSLDAAFTADETARRGSGISRSARRSSARTASPG